MNESTSIVNFSAIEKKLQKGYTISVREMDDDNWMAKIENRIAGLLVIVCDNAPEQALERCFVEWQNLVA